MLQIDKKRLETLKDLFAIDPSIVPVTLSLLKKILFVCSLMSCVFWITDMKFYIPGLIFGAFMGWINFFLMGKGVTMMANDVLRTKKKSTGQKRLIFGYFIRYIILSIAFIIAVTVKIFTLSTFILGLFLIQIILYIEYVFMGFGNEKK